MNVRWDAVVDRSAVASLKAPPPTAQQCIVDRDADNIRVRVQLFGALAALCARQSVELALRPGLTLAELVELLADQFGEAFPTHVIDTTGAKRRHCRLFVAGYPVEDLQTPLYPATEPTEIDIILLIAPEGG